MLADGSEFVEVPRFVDPDCPVCEYEPRPDEAVRCVGCDRLHHMGCWLDAKGCGEPGCDERHVEVPRLDAGDPPVARLRRQAEPRMWFFVFFAGYVVGSYAAVFLAPLPAREALLKILGGGLIAACLALWAAQRWVTRTYTFDPARQFVAKETRLGPFAWARRTDWLPVEHVHALAVQLVRRTLSSDDDPEYVVQVWLRSERGADLVLREERLDRASPGFAALRDAARVARTKVQVTVLGEAPVDQLHVSSITGMPFRPPA